MNPVLKWALLNLIIFPFRPKRSSEAYKKIWYPEGSPLISLGRLEAEVNKALPDLDVVLAMRYGNPSLSSGIDALVRSGCDRIILFPSIHTMRRAAQAQLLKRCTRIGWSLEQSSVPLFRRSTIIHPSLNRTRLSLSQS